MTVNGIKLSPDLERTYRCVRVLGCATIGELRKKIRSNESRTTLHKRLGKLRRLNLITSKVVAKSHKVTFTRKRRQQAYSVVNGK